MTTVPLPMSPTVPSGRRPVLGEMRALALLAGPLLLGNVAQMAINTTDVLILGRYDVDALAAAALAVNLLFAFGTFGMGLMTAVAPMIAAERGARGHSVRDIRRTVRQGCWAAVAICLPIWFALWHAEAIFLLMGQEADLAQQAGEFLRIAMWGLLPWLTQFAMRMYVSALERPMWGVFVTVCAMVVNVIACWVLVFGELGFPELGLMGAAWANLIANSTLLIVMVAVVTTVRPFRRYRLFGRFWQPDWPRFVGIFRLGLPIAVTFAFEVAIFSAAAFLMGIISREALAAHAVAIQIAAFAFMLPFSLSQAATVRVGLFHGRRDAEGAGRAGWIAIAIGLAAAVVMSGAMALAARDLVGLFIDVEDRMAARAFDLAVSFVLVAAIFQLADGMQAVGAGVLRGLQDTRWPMLFAAFGYWVVGFGVAWLLAFRFEWGGVGVWTGLATGLTAVALLMIGRWAGRGRLGLDRYETAA